MTASQGLDTSSNNHNTRAKFAWSEVLDAGYTWTINKCTEGRGYVNPFYNGPSGTDANDAAAAGLHSSAYHFARPETNSPQTESAWFLQNCGNPDSKWIDFESGLGILADQDLANWLVIMMNLTNATGWYWNHNYHNRLYRLIKPSDIANRLLWMAGPNDDEWPHGAWIWQYGQGAVPGVGVVDLNRAVVL